MSTNPNDFSPISSSKSSRALKSAAAIAVLAGGIGLSYGTSAQSASTPPVHETAIPHQLYQGAPFSFADLVQKVSPAVVSVVVIHDGPRVAADTGDSTDNAFEDLFRQFGQGQGQFQGRRFQFGPDMGNGGRGNGRQGQGRSQMRAPRSEARGSGYIIESNGYIVTNNHVVDGGNKITVHLADGRDFDAKVVGTDKDTDVALLKVEARNLPTVAFGEDKMVRVGDWVVAVGNPFGLGGTVTAGIVSSIHRDIGNGPYTDYMQIDAPINQGNSGGPTFDMNGRVVGMNTAIYSPSGGSVGIGFAIPASTIQAIISQLKEHGAVTRGWLGVQIQTLTPELAASMGSDTTKGAIVASIVGNSPASRAGMRQGDVIVALNGDEVTDSGDLTRKVANLSAGSKADFTVMRDGRKQTLSATIAKRDTQVSSNERGQGSDDAAPSSDTMLGMELAPVNPETRRQYGLGDDAKGVVVTSVDPDSDAAGNGVQRGDVIVSIGGKAVHSPADVKKTLADAKEAGRNSVLILVGGQQGEHFVPVKIA